MEEKQEDLRIRHAIENDQSNIIEFIRNNWAQDHVFVRHPELFSYYYKNGNSIQFVLAEDKHGKIYGICGYLKTNQGNPPGIMTSFWKTVKSNNLLLGIDIINYIKDYTNADVFACCGITLKTIPIYEFLGYYTGKLNHFYRLMDKEHYEIAVIRSKQILPANISQKIRWESNITEEQFKHYGLSDSIDVLKKDSWYVLNKYYRHPVYHYHIHSMVNNDTAVRSYIICREIIQNQTKILRIVDFIGSIDDLRYISTFIQDLIDLNQYEYIDFYNFGIEEEIMYQAGFIKRKENDENIIPNYFEPFVQSNIELYFFTDTTQNFHLFKGDGDQDRPNML